MIIRLVTNLIVFALVTAAASMALTWYMASAGSTLTTERFGPWVTWNAIGRSDADPYTRAHVIQSGTMPLSTSVARIYRADVDDEGRPLIASCDYAIKGSGPDAVWWLLAVYDTTGRLIDNRAARFGFTSEDILRGPDGTFQVTLARGTRAGNWLPSGRSGQRVLVLTALQPRYRGASEARENDRAVEAAQLPSITQQGCR
ncbi:MAG: DUF1214 domain-containing protein [Pseudomonadota bacterium]